MVEHEDLVAQHGEAVEVVGALLVRDRDHPPLEARDVAFEGDGDLVAEPALQPRGDDPEQPGEVAETPSPTAAAITSPSSPSTTPLPSRASHSAISASGSAASSDSTNAVTSSRGSWR